MNTMIPTSAGTTKGFWLDFTSPDVTDEDRALISELNAEQFAEVVAAATQTVHETAARIRVRRQLEADGV